MSGALPGGLVLENGASPIAAHWQISRKHLTAELRVRTEDCRTKTESEGVAVRCSNAHNAMPTIVAEALDRYRHIALRQLRESRLTETVGISVCSRCINKYPRLLHSARTQRAVHDHDKRSILVQCQYAVATLGPINASRLSRWSGWTIEALDDLRLTVAARRTANRDDCTDKHHEQTHN